MSPEIDMGFFEAVTLSEHALITGNDFTAPVIFLTERVGIPRVFTRFGDIRNQTSRGLSGYEIRRKVGNKSSQMLFNVDIGCLRTIEG